MSSEEDEFPPEWECVIEVLEDLVDDYRQGYSNRVPETSERTIELIKSQEQTIKELRRELDAFKQPKPFKLCWDNWFADLSEKDNSIITLFKLREFSSSNNYTAIDFDGNDRHTLDCLTIGTLPNNWET